MVHEPAHLFPPTEVPHLDDLVRAPRRKPLAAGGRRRDSLDAGNMGGEDEHRLERERERAVGPDRDAALQAVEQLLVRARHDLERGR
jgi:hypothetical protein